MSNCEKHRSPGRADLKDILVMGESDEVVAAAFDSVSRMIYRNMGQTGPRCDCPECSACDRIAVVFLKLPKSSRVWGLCSLCAHGFFMETAEGKKWAQRQRHQEEQHEAGFRNLILRLRANEKAREQN